MSVTRREHPARAVRTNLAQTLGEAHAHGNYIVKMQLGDLLCCLLLTITVTATCAREAEDSYKRGIAVGKSKRLLKRDAAIIFDNFPIEPVYHKPKVIYRRLSRQRYGPPKSKYGSPRPKYGPPPKPRKPAKKYRKKINNNYGPPPSHKKRGQKPRYPGKRPTSSSVPVYGPPKKLHYYAHDPAGFAEPPEDYEPQQKPKPSYAEPPVDSYGAPLKAPAVSYPTAPSYNETPSPSSFDNQDFTNYAQDFDSWQNYQREENHDNTFEYSKKRPLYATSDDIFDHPQHPEIGDFNLNAYSDAYKYNNDFKEPAILQNLNKKPSFFFDMNKSINKHWKSPRLRPGIQTEEVLVGGQYAEPPPRYVPKFQPSAPMYNNDDDFSPPRRFIDSDVAASATISPYVNYKHSNMAFSPQNLNDAFSIVDK